MLCPPFDKSTILNKMSVEAMPTTLTSLPLEFCIKKFIWMSQGEGYEGRVAHTNARVASSNANAG